MGEEVSEPQDNESLYDRLLMLSLTLLVLRWLHGSLDAQLGLPMRRWIRARKHDLASYEGVYTM